jgi:hypothetical protein
MLHVSCVGLHAARTGLPCGFCHDALSPRSVRLRWDNAREHGDSCTRAVSLGHPRVLKFVFSVDAAHVSVRPAAELRAENGL